MDISKYRKLFFEETREHLLALNNLLLDLEKDPGRRDNISEIFRLVHTIKGMAGTMGYQPIVQLTHELESLLLLLREGRADPTPEIVEMLFTGFDLLQALVEAEAKGKKAPDISSFLSRLTPLIEGLTREREEGTAAPDSVRSYEAVPSKAKERRVFQVSVRISPKAPLKGARAGVVITRLKSVGEIVSSSHPLPELMKGGFDLSFEIVIATGSQKGEIEEVLSTVPELDEVRVVEVLPEEPSTEERAEEEKEAGFLPFFHEETTSIRVDMSRLDSLLNLVGELTIAQGRISRLARERGLSELEEAVVHLSRLTSSIREEVMEARMVPVAQVFDLFPRFIREASRAMGKEVQLVLEGREMELDRMLLDRITEPLVHLMRNALSHGIEPPEERLKRGKPREGTVKLSAERRRNFFHIEVADDGRGIDVNQVGEVALKLGLVSEEELAGMSEKERLMLIVKPGFSTLTEATEVSGRGVGLDVVMKQVRSLGGDFLIKSELGKGTSFTIILPLTLAITRVLPITIGGENYLIPLSYIEEMVERSDVDIKRTKGRDFLSHRGELVPLLELRELLGIPPAGSDDGGFILIVGAEGRKGAFSIDSFGSQEEVMVKPLPPLRTALPCFCGTTILGGGEVVLLFDVMELISLAVSPQK
ncbi:MAG: chemotaxis protein CheA [Acidobacteria bacterium]|nr:chemotaxis protein CheA [Acidobacteriota bacterium]